jgi:hypothetical protein
MTKAEKQRAIEIADKIAQQVEFQEARDSSKPHTVTLTADEATWLAQKFLDYCCWDYARQKGLRIGPNPNADDQEDAS